MAKKPTKQKNNCFLLSWDCNGLEACVSLHELEQKYEQADKERVWSTLVSQSGEDPGNPVDREINRIYSSILMRARMNSQRHYEVYTVQTDSSISREDMIGMFKDSPQSMADLVRERGEKLYSDRAVHAPCIV
jgi:hypothetical protein